MAARMVDAQRTQVRKRLDNKNRCLHCSGFFMPVHPDLSLLLITLSVVLARYMKPEDRFETFPAESFGVAANGVAAHAFPAAIIK